MNKILTFQIWNFFVFLSLVVSVLCHFLPRNEKRQENDMKFLSNTPHTHKDTLTNTSTHTNTHIALLLSGFWDYLIFDFPPPRNLFLWGEELGKGAFWLEARCVCELVLLLFDFVPCNAILHAMRIACSTKSMPEAFMRNAKIIALSYVWLLYVCYVIV